jgi:phenylpropionate dioxygenase-like ring-hydroxylating dioxygenase large terminal subunit
MGAKMSFPDHCWYAVATLSQVGSEPKAIRFLGQEIVLRRSAQGRIQALAGRCAHRGCSLASGWTEQDRLVCPYHGWQYRSDGECVHIPALRAGELIPSQARLRAFPIHERHGLVWLWWSSEGREPTDSIAELPELDALELHPGGDIEFRYHTHYTRTLENGIDPTHAAFVHGGSIGKADPDTDFSLDPYELRFDPNTFYARMPIKVKKVNGLMRLLLRGETNPYKEYRYIFPNLVVSTIHFGRFSLSALQAHVPEDNEYTSVRVTNARNFFHGIPLLSKWFDGVARSTGVKISTEDEAVISDQQPKEVAFKGSREVLVRSDEILIAFRRMMRQHGESESPSA